MQDDIPSECRVVPFGNLRIKGYLHLPEAYRSLSRPSSPPRAKASAMCPYLLFVLPITYGRYILSAFNFTFFWSHHVKERCFNYKTIIKTEWRITDSNRWPPACKAGALASWANPPSYKWKTESGKWKIRRVPDFHFSIFSFQLWSSPRQSWTADLYIISVAL